MRKKNSKILITLTLALFLCLGAGFVWSEAITVTGPEQVVLSLTEDSSKMAVTWCDADTASNGAIFYSTDPALAGAQTAAAVSTATGSGFQYFEGTMGGLSAGQTYYYKVGSTGSFSNVNSFKVPDSNTFMYLGDVQYVSSGSIDTDYNNWKTLVQNACAANPNTAFILQGGDMVNNGQNPEEWQAFLTRADDISSKVPVMPIAGNHESNATSGKPELYLGIFDLPKNGPSGFKEEFYSFDYGDCHFTCLNSNIFLNEQLGAGTMTLDDFDRIKTWIAADLSGSSKKWKIVVMHHPAYIVDSDTAAAKVLSQWAPVFEDNGVSLVLCGHQHTYMRTYPMFDREINADGGITYIMGNSGSKFYPGKDVDYDACMIENTSNYQMIQAADSGLTVTTYNGTGSLLDSIVVTPPVSSERSITLDYDSSVATVTASSAAIRGDTVMVQISNLSSAKKVKAVTVTDKNEKTYTVATVTANAAYSFTMPNRSVTVRVEFEDNSGSGSGTGEYYSCTTNLNGDPIWDIDLYSSGASSSDSKKISAGSTVSVTVTRQVRDGDRALCASLNGLTIKDSKGSTVAVTSVSTATDSQNGTIKFGKYEFTMPASAVTITPDVAYQTLSVYARSSSSEPYTLKKTFTMDMLNYSHSSVYYTGYDRLPTAVIGKATGYIRLTDLLNQSGITLTKDSVIEMYSDDKGSRSFTYDQLFGQTRYYYKNIDTGSASGKTAIQPIIVAKGYQNRFTKLVDEKGKKVTIDDMTQDTFDSYRFAFGQTEEEFNGGIPAADDKHAKVHEFLKWTTSIKVTGCRESSAVTPIPGGGAGTVVVEAAATVDAAGKASVTLDAASVKSSMIEALNKVKGSDMVPEVKINVQVDKTAKSAEVTLPAGVLKELTTPDNLLATISTPFGDISLDKEVLKSIQTANSGKDLKIAILPVSGRKAGTTDGREVTDTVVDINMTSGSQAVTGFGTGRLQIKIPFKPAEGKKANGYYVVWLTDDGKAERMQGSPYQPDTGLIQFETGHLSRYAVAYTSNTAINVYGDLKENAWYADCVTFVTENGYFQGTGTDTFGPGADMTRAMFCDGTRADKRH